ncbi:tudor domain-containing protein 1 [Elysia marginata]|uniref:Tudor domain-containing protein 1 n=1 Tax=Elysia marginata TaxID=1093978 RepID=A0AAV4G3G8_9GAST|nr:tudor domain-containing protein 1 [Elysia marginata]
MECGHFWGQCDDEQTRDVLLKVQMALNNPEAPLLPLTHKPVPGLHVAAPYQDGEELYYRARIEDMTSQRVPGATGRMVTISKALVFFIDFGNKESVNTDRLRMLPRDCQNLPSAATEFYLKGIRPSNVRCADGMWSSKANAYFRSLTINKNLYAQTAASFTLAGLICYKYWTREEIHINFTIYLVVKVDPDSVNCVAVDDDPCNKFSRLMVASFIGLNPAGNTMVARNTTIMPQIPGLPAIVALLFSPFTEYRTDPQRKEYIGALCGLGYDEDSLPILPDHDIELTFETEFTTQDIAMVCSDSAFGWGHNVVASIQERARTSLLALLKKPKPAREPKTYPYMYRWNKVHPEHVLHHNLRDTTADSNHLLRLHNAIALVGGEESQDKDWEEAGNNGGNQQNKKQPRYLLKHQLELERIAKSQHRKPVHCELCNITATNSQILAIHMQTDRHLRMVKKLQESLKS